MNAIAATVVFVVLAGLVYFQWRTMKKAREREGQDVPELDPQVDAKLRERGKVLLYFFSPSCGPCRRMTPTIDNAALTHDNVFKFDVSRSTEVARKLGVMATPTTVQVVAGKIAGIRLGILSDAAIEEMLA